MIGRLHAADGLMAALHLKAGDLTSWSVCLASMERRIRLARGLTGSGPAVAS